LDLKLLEEKEEEEGLILLKQVELIAPKLIMLSIKLNL
jgi:hypothetical protein